MLAYSGKGKFVIQPLDLSEMLEGMGKLIAVSVPKHVRIEQKLAAGLPPVEADIAQMQQVALNLITNAAEAIGEKQGTITLATGRMHCDAEWLAASLGSDDAAPGDYVWLEVADTGCGMTPEVLERIFDPFFTTKSRGRGLGLAAALGIARAHEGALLVRSRPGSGTTFRLLLPFQPARPAEAPTRPVRARLPSAGWGTVLVVDDEPAVRRITARVLAGAGYRVAEADGVAGGRRVLREVGAGELRAAVLDLTMPDGTGEELARELWQERADLPVLFLTGYDEAAVRVAADPRRRAAALHKPCGRRELLAALEDLLGGPEA